MSGLKRFFALGQENSIFKFTIDTRNIVAGATNGSENPLTFRFPIFHSSANPVNCILKVSDGRPDIVLNSSNISTPLLFSTAGIYTITMIGSGGNFQATNVAGYDIRKIISVDSWSSKINFINFNGCVNCEFLATNILMLPSNASGFFANTKGFPSQDLSNIIVRDVTTAPNILQNVPTKFKKLFNPFWSNLTSGAQLYTGLDVTELEILEIRSNSVTTITGLLTGTRRNFYGKIILDTPNLTNIGGLCYYFNAPPALDKCDVSNVTTTLNFLFTSMATVRVDATLIAWSNLPYMQSGVTWNWLNSKYSNNPAVIAALNKITNEWGVIFTNLTMALKNK